MCTHARTHARTNTHTRTTHARLDEQVIVVDDEDRENEGDLIMAAVRSIACLHLVDWFF